MFSPQKDNRRRPYDERLDCGDKIDLLATFVFTAEIDLRCPDGEREGSREKGYYRGTVKNVSAQGMCLVTATAFSKGQTLILELMHPSSKAVIRMEGEVRWCRSASSSISQQYEVGVKIIKVNDQDVERSVTMDPIYHTLWSIVLESIFGETKHTLLKTRKTSHKS
jgi:Tfp pilus assembly protein PilZ